MWAAFAASAVHAAPAARFVATPVQGAVCVAPCVVHLDATATTSSEHPRPFSELDYAWDCGEPGAGAWSNRTGGDKNRPRGPVTGCVYATPGEKTIRLAVRERDGDAASAETTVAVVDPDARFSGARTVCISAAGEFAGCPAGAQRVTSGDFDAALTDDAGCNADAEHKRCLLRCGERFEQDAAVLLAPGATPALLSCFGAASGRAEVASVTELGVVERGWTIDRIAWSNATAGSGGFDLSPVNGNVTLHDVAITTRGAPNVTHQLAGDRHPDLVAIVGDVHTILRTSADRFSQHFLRARRQLLLGNVFDANGEGEFNVRSVHTPLSAIQHNELLDPQDDVDNVRNPLQLRAFADASGTGLPRAPTQYVVVSDNHMETPLTGTETGTVVRTCQENGCNESPGEGVDMVDVLFERNAIRATSTWANASAGVFYLQGGRITVRNNVIDLQGMDSADGAANALVIHFPNQSRCPDCVDDEIVVQGNTVYWNERSRRGLRLCESLAGGADHVCQLNLAWLPNDAGERTEVGAGSWTAGGNVFAESNPFAAPPPAQGRTQAADFRLADASPARDRLADVARPTALSRDFGRFCREAAASGALDAGAWERGASDCTGAAPRPPVCGDGVVERGESCDDGNVRDGDACSARCRTGGLFGSHLSVFDEADAPSRRRVSLVLRDAAVELPAHGDGDPTQVGALLVLRNPGTGEEARVALPAKGWSALGIPAGSRGYRYRDPARDAGPCELADARAGRWIRAFCSGERLGFTLDEPAQSALTATFGVGDAHPMCAAFASPYVRRDVPAIGTAPGAFLGRAAPAPAFCEPP